MLVQKLCDKHGADQAQRGAIEREVDASSILRSGKLTRTALDELEARVAGMVETSRQGGAITSEYNARPDMGSRLLNVNFSGGSFSSSAVKPRRTTTWSSYRDVSANVDMIDDYITHNHLTKDPIKQCAALAAPWPVSLLALSRLACAARSSHPVPDTPRDVQTSLWIRLLFTRRYVEKALQLHDGRRGMPVVSSPVWDFKPSNAPKK